MTILARRFTIICLVMGLFAAGLTVVVESSARRIHAGPVELGAPCPEPAGAFCRAAL